MQKTVKIRPGQTVLEAALANKIPVATSCGGMGTCGACRVFIESDLSLLPERNEIEVEMAEDRKFAPNERLACQTEAFGGLCVSVPED